MSLSILEIILIFLASLIGVLTGLYIAFLILKKILLPNDKKDRSNVDKRRRRNNDQTQHEQGPIEQKSDSDASTDHTNGSKQPEVSDPEDIHEESKYSDGSVLSEKLKRDSFDAYDYNSSLDGETPQERVKRTQSREDSAYSILKDKKK